MPLVASEVDIAITGELFSAPRDTAAPTDASTALPAAWIGHGYVSQDGVTESWDDSVDNIVAWQSATVVRTPHRKMIRAWPSTPGYSPNSTPPNRPSNGSASTARPTICLPCGS
ncbi:phage tail tube protein [Nocardia asteroides]